MKKKLAVAYVRVSSKSQNVDRQVEELTKYAESVNFKLVRCFNDTISGFKSEINERPGFKKLKAFVLDEKNNVKNLLVHEVSRLGRKNFEVQNTIEEFYQHKINIHFKDLSLSTLDENGLKSPESSIIISILASMAENENRLLVDRIKSGLLNSARKGLAFSDKITGYEKGLDGKPVIDENDAPLVRRMYELAANKNTVYFISNKINSEFGRVFGSKTISGIIKNPFYKGKRKYLGETILVDKIVDEEVWETANTFLSSRKNFTKRYRVYDNIVEGKVECYNCGNPMYQIVNLKGRSNMYKCSNSCSTSVNRPWLFEMIRYVIDKHTKKINDKEFKVSLNNKIEENQQFALDLKKDKYETEEAQLINYQRFLKKKVKEIIYEKSNDKFEKNLISIEMKLKDCVEKNNSYRLALQSKPTHFSYDLKTYKVQIQDILKEVEVGNDFVVINIFNLVTYNIPQLNGTKIGWINKKNIDQKMVFESPFKTGLKIKNIINDEDLDLMVNNEIYDYDDDSEIRVNK